MRLFLVLIIAAACSACSSFDTTYFLNNFETLAETPNDTPTLSVRVFKIQEEGECDNGECPQAQLYIAVSEFGEYPDKNVFITEKADAWHFSDWISIPKLGDEPLQSTFRVKKTIGNNQHSLIVTVDTKTVSFMRE